MMRRLLSIVLLAPLTAMAQNVPLNTSQTLTLPAVAAGQEAISTGFFFDVPVGARAIRVQIESLPSTRDVDLFLRDSAWTGVSSATAMFNAARFSSIGGTSAENLLITPSQLPPLKPGSRWFIGLVVPAGAAGTATLRVDALDQIPRPAPELVFLATGNSGVECDANAWSDPAPFTPIGGNTATTLGQARQNAFRHSAQLLMNQIEAPVSLVFSGCWRRLGIQSPTRFTLGQAGPTGVIRDSPGLERSNVWYTRAPASKAGGTDFCRVSGSPTCERVDVRATFNLDVGTQSTRSFGYHLDGAGLANTIDFVAVATHELTHGLGFLSLITISEPTATAPAPLGSLFSGRADIFSLNLVDFRDPSQVRALTDPSMSDADRVAAIGSGGELRWNGAETVSTIENTVRNAEDTALGMFSPNPIQPGSSASHLAVPSCNMMNALLASSCGSAVTRNLGINKSMMNALGWASAPKRPVTGPWFDRTRSGTGFDLHMAGTDPDGNALYALGFYSYDSGNAPEWYLASGFLREGVFEGSTVALKKNLARFTRSAGQVQIDAPRSGRMTIDFNDAASDPVCLAVPRTGAAQLAVVRWYIGQVLWRDWCIEPTSPPSLRPALDYTGIYWAGPEDQGWGVTATAYQPLGQPAQLSVAVYFYAANGEARWVAGTADVQNFNAPITVPMLALSGFCRDCLPTAPSNAPAGSVTLDFRGSQSSADNRMTINVNYPLAGGGSWVRSNIPMRLFTLSNPNP